MKRWLSTESVYTGRFQRGKHGVYLLAVYAPDSGLVLRQVETGAKENELLIP